MSESTESRFNPEEFLREIEVDSVKYRVFAEKDDLLLVGKLFVPVPGDGDETWLDPVWVNRADFDEDPAAAMKAKENAAASVANHFDASAQTMAKGVAKADADQSDQEKQAKAKRASSASDKPKGDAKGRRTKPSDIKPTDDPQRMMEKEEGKAQPMFNTSHPLSTGLEGGEDPEPVEESAPTQSAVVHTFARNAFGKKIGQAASEATRSGCKWKDIWTPKPNRVQITVPAGCELPAWIAKIGHTTEVQTS